MKKISVKICTGTACFSVGSANVQKLKDVISDKYGDKAEVTVTNCLGLCSINWEHSKAPYVKVGEEVVSEATVERVVDEINRQLSKK